MGRILAIDYGMKRTGLAVTDPLQIIATGLTTVSTKELLTYIQNYCKAEEVDTFVIGDSKHLDNTDTNVKQHSVGFSRKLQALFPDKTIAWIDERFTSKMASQSMVMSGMKKKKRQQKALIDEISATIILQSYMEKKSFLF
ncbi:MAG: Holliday junction resolvase RuvX [Chitinophagales bacterium]